MSEVRSFTPLPPADFTPEPGNYKTLQPFRYWCQKVLPLVYDDSLSYYELLCKVVDYLNKTMEDVETLHGDITNLHTAYEQLQNYVNTYFSNLDVQEEINNKLDELVSNGTLTSIVSAIIGNQAFPIFVDNVDKMTQHGRIYVLTTNGHIYQWDGSKFVDTNVAYTQPKNVLMYGALYNSDFDFDDVAFNTFNPVAIPGTPNPTNAPHPFSNGLVICYGGESGTNRGAKQVYIDTTGDMFNRTYNGTTWTKWVGLSTSKFLQFGALYNSDFDFDDVAFNTYNPVAIPGTPNPTNAPHPFSNGLVICYGGESGANKGAKQVYIDTAGNMFNRTYSGVYWTEWCKHGNEYYVTNVDELVKVIPKCNNDTTVYVAGGDYDLSNYPESNDYGMVFTGTWIGLSNPRLFINLNEPSQYHSVINAPKDYLCMDGFTIENTNGRYCIHDEMNGAQLNGGTHIYKNCRLIHHSDASELWKYPRCFGCGVGRGINIVIENTYFKSVIDTPCDIHSDGGTQTTFCSVRIKNCYFENGTVTLREAGSGATKELLYVECSGNLLHSDIVDSSNVFNLAKWNNEVIN